MAAARISPGRLVAPASAPGTLRRRGHYALAPRLVLGAAILCVTHLVHAQELNPRAYLITPTGTNVINVAYSHLDGNLNFDGGQPITGAQSSSSVTAFGYYRSFGLLGRSANFSVAVPYGIGDFEGTVVGVPKSAHRSGFLDSSYRLAVNLIGGAAMEPQEFAKWRQNALLGVSLKIVAPTGQYDPTLLVNWGSNRWAFKPEIGYSQRWNHWVLDAYAAGWFFTENPEYFSRNQYYAGVRSQTQSPVFAFEGHLSYDVRPRLWLSLDANYWAGGETSVNGVTNPATGQKSSRVGVTASIPITARQSIKISYSDGAYVRYGGNYRTVFASWQYGWVGWPTH